MKTLNEMQMFYDAIENGDVTYLQENVHNFDDLNFFVRKSAEVGNVECLKILLKACRTFDGDGQQALIRAVHFKYMDCVKKLLDHPCINPTYAFNGALCSALQNNDRECVALLAPVSDFSMDGIHTVLAYPLQHGYMECFQSIIDEFDKPQRFAELAYCVLDSAEHGAYEVAERIAPHEPHILQEILDTHDRINQKNGAAWVSDRLLKVHLERTLGEPTHIVKRKI